MMGRACRAPLDTQVVVVPPGWSPLLVLQGPVSSGGLPRLVVLPSASRELRATCPGYQAPIPRTPGSLYLRVNTNSALSGRYARNFGVVVTVQGEEPWPTTSRIPSRTRLRSFSLDPRAVPPLLGANASPTVYLSVL